MTVSTTREGAVLTVTIDRPEHGNRLDGETVDKLTASFEGVREDREPPAVAILRSTGPDFSHGRESKAGASQAPKAITAEFRRIQRLNEAVQRCPAVTIAAVTGRCEGAGLSLAARCDIVVVADDASLSFPEIPHGIPPTIVLSHYRYVLPRSILGDLIYAGRVLSGSESVAFGLAARCMPLEKIDPEVAALAEKISGFDRESVMVAKDFLMQSENLFPSQAPTLGIAVYTVEMSGRAQRQSST